MIKISKNQYDLYVFFTRKNFAEIFNDEKEWYMNKLKTLWGVICLDKQDNNYSVVISARDKNKQIRCIEVEISFDTIDSAREWLFARVKRLEKEEKYKNYKEIDIFTPIVKESKLDSFFV